MHYLVGVTAQEKLMRLAERLQNELELDHGQVLHLVDHDKIIARLDEGEVVVAQDIRINWLRVLDTAESSQVDQCVGHQLHAIMPLLDTFETE